MNDDPRRHAPAAGRNRGPILKILRQYLPQAGKILEIASGTGEHISYFAAAIPVLNWQPTDIDTEALASIAAYCEDAALANLSPPRRLDVRSSNWPVGPIAGVLCINMIHIAPWSCCVGLVRGAAEVLEGCDPLILYGPFKRNGIHTAPTNAIFDRRLQKNNLKWGLRDIEAVEAEARNVGLDESTVIDMPSNNYCLILRRGITNLE
tara:strand:- start:5235 stop:5855 length:621 start_codon:yes stop_codon:yes gene_type:complete